MLYIEKMEVPPKVKRAQTKIKSSPEWKTIAPENAAAIGAQFDTLPKPEIRQGLLQEQRHLCSYCMKRIKDDPGETGMIIEHWAPLSKHKDLALDYTNFLGVCKGGAKTKFEDKKQNLCCDASKEDKEIMLNPCNFEMMKHIAYRTEGTVYFLPSSSWEEGMVRQLERDINETLCLNGNRDPQGGLKADTRTRLLKGRKEAYEKVNMLIRHLEIRGKITSRELEKEIRKIQESDQLPEFAGVTLFFLNRIYENLIKQGK